MRPVFIKHLTFGSLAASVSLLIHSFKLERCIKNIASALVQHFYSQLSLYQLPCDVAHGIKTMPAFICGPLLEKI